MPVAGSASFISRQTHLLAETRVTVLKVSQPKPAPGDHLLLWPLEASDDV